MLEARQLTKSFGAVKALDRLDLDVSEGEIVCLLGANGAGHDVFRAKEIGTRIGIMKAGRLVDILDASQLDAGEIERIYLAHMHEDGVVNTASARKLESEGAPA